MKWFAESTVEEGVLVRENVRANLRRLVKRTLKNYGYPPDKQEKATETVLELAALHAEEWRNERPALSPTAIGKSLDGCLYKVEVRDPLLGQGPPADANRCSRKPMRVS